MRRTIGLMITVALSCLVVPHMAAAQLQAKVPQIGWLSSGSPLSEAQRQQSP